MIHQYLLISCIEETNFVVEVCSRKFSLISEVKSKVSVYREFLVQDIHPGLPPLLCKEG